MHDHLLRATVAGSVRAVAAITTDLTEEARKRHDCYPVAAAALGRTMTAALLLAASLKNDESLTIRIAGDGPAREVIVDARADGTVRGYLKQPHVDLPLRNGKLDVGGAIGEGHIYVTRFTGLKQPFTGTAPLVSGEIAEDVTNYLLVSEQTPSSVALGVLVQPDGQVIAAGGFFVQVMPDADEGVLSQLEQNLAQLPPVSQLVQNGFDAKGMLETVFAGLPLTLHDESPVAFQCTCSKERVGNVLISLGVEELQSLREEGQAEVSCHFCAERYVFKADDLQELCQQAVNKA